MLWGEEKGGGVGSGFGMRGGRGGCGGLGV